MDLILKIQEKVAGTLPGLNFLLIAQCHHKELSYNDCFINMTHQRPTFDIGQEKELHLTGARFNEFGIDQPELLCPKQPTCFLSIFFYTCLSSPFWRWVVRRRPLFLSTSPVFAIHVSPSQLTKPPPPPHVSSSKVALCTAPCLNLQPPTKPPRLAGNSSLCY